VAGAPTRSDRTAGSTGLITGMFNKWNITGDRAFITPHDKVCEKRPYSMAKLSEPKHQVLVLWSKAWSKVFP
jgi:hypothetical protein